jgi:predicted Zn-dependent protease
MKEGPPERVALLLFRADRYVICAAVDAFVVDFPVWDLAGSGYALRSSKPEGAMRKLIVSILLIGAIGAAPGMASAQKSLSAGMDLDAMDRSQRIAEQKRRDLEIPRKAGIEALQKEDFAAAETSFATLLSKTPTTSDANYLMGLAQIGLKKWPEAQQYLEVAVKEEPKRPEPKMRLGIAGLMTGDFGVTNAQRAELADLASKCGRCEDSRKITDNLATLDKVIAAANKAAAPASAPAE